MFAEKWLSEKGFRLSSIVLFCFLFTYLLFRAYSLDWLHDEAATFLHYIETGIYWGPASILDANNHLLNSVVCHELFKIFGENKFILRLPNVLSFPLYFWAIYQLISVHKIPFFRLLVLVGTTSIPFVLEYFAYTRGYGISLAFFMASLVFLRRLSKEITLKSHGLVALCLAIAAYSNLTFLVSIVLASLFILIQQFRQKDNISKKQQVLHFGIHLAFAVIMIPAAIFARILKEGGALYYGSLEGFWQVTGVSLSKTVLFTDHILLKWVFIALGLIVVLTLVKDWLKIRFQSFFQQTNTILAWFLFGHVSVILILAFFMEVNYPEDRVGMYMIPLTLLLLAGIIEKYAKLSVLYFGFLFFPIALIPKMNLVTSIFSPEDRMSEDFYDKVNQEITSDETSLTMYHLMGLTWPILNRKSNRVSVPAVSGDANTSSDIIMSRRNLKLPAKDLVDYDTLYAEPYENGGFIAFKRKLPFQKTTLLDTLISKPKSTFEFMEINRFTIPDSLRNQRMQIHVSGEIIIDDPLQSVVLTYSVFDKSEQNTFQDYWATRWYNGLKHTQRFNLNIPVEKWTETDGEFRIYFFNPQNTGLELKNSRFKLMLLE